MQFTKIDWLIHITTIKIALHLVMYAEFKQLLDNKPIFLDAVCTVFQCLNNFGNITPGK